MQFKTNWYLENNKVPVLGMAFVLMDGALCELRDALEAKDIQYIHISRVYLSQIIPLYVESAKKPDWNFLITPRYLSLGKVILEEAETMLQRASSVLSGSLKGMSD